MGEAKDQLVVGLPTPTIQKSERDVVGFQRIIFLGNWGMGAILVLAANCL